jgi:hypothetical protein
MADRAAILAAIDEVYRLRIRGDKPAMQALFAPGARIQLAGAAELMPGLRPVPRMRRRRSRP